MSTGSETDKIMIEVQATGARAQDREERVEQFREKRRSWKKANLTAEELLSLRHEGLPRV